MDDPDRQECYHAVDGILNGKHYSIHDRDPLFTAEFLRMLAGARRRVKSCYCAK
jgi:hypothetical protein